MIEIIRDGMFLNNACDNIFRKCSHHVVNEVKTDLESITTDGAITKGDKEFTNHSSYLEHVMHDEMIRPYMSMILLKLNFLRLTALHACKD